MTIQSLKIFNYIEDLDGFVVSEQYCKLADELGLSEWNPVVWMGRLFSLDNDYGEHWFDNWDLREQIKDKAEKLGIADHDLMIIDPNRFKNEVDGPCHPPEIRKQFWTDVLKSLKLSYDLLFAEARAANAENLNYYPEGYIEDLEARIERIKGNNDAQND